MIQSIDYINTTFFSKINRLTLFLIGWKCPVQEYLHPYLVIKLIQLKIVLGF